NRLGRQILFEFLPHPRRKPFGWRRAAGHADYAQTLRQTGIQVQMIERRIQLAQRQIAVPSHDQEITDHSRSLLRLLVAPMSGMPNSLASGQFPCVTVIPFLQNTVLKKIVSMLIISALMKPTPDTSLGFPLNDVTRLLRCTFDRQSLEIGLTRAQWLVLVHLSRRNGVQPNVLAKVMEITPITLGRHLDRLENDNWIER